MSWLLKALSHQQSYQIQLQYRKILVIHVYMYRIMTVKRGWISLTCTILILRNDKNQQFSMSSSRLQDNSGDLHLPRCSPTWGRVACSALVCQGRCGWRADTHSPGDSPRHGHNQGDRPGAVLSLGCCWWRYVHLVLPPECGGSPTDSCLTRPHGWSYCGH